MTRGAPARRPSAGRDGVGSLRAAGRRVVDPLAEIVVILALAIDMFAALPAPAAQDALQSGMWDLARYVDGPVAARVQARSDSLPLLLGAIVLLAALSSSSGSRKRDRW